MGIFGGLLSSLGGIWGTQFPPHDHFFAFCRRSFNRRSFRPPLPTRRPRLWILHGMGAGVRYLLVVFWSLDTLATCFRNAARLVGGARERHLRLLGRTHPLWIDSRRRVRHYKKNLGSLVHPVP